MSSSSPSASCSRTGAGRGLAGLREVVDQLRPATAPRGDERPKGADVRADVLTVLADEPSTGYRVVRVLEERGGRSPGAGAVYPVLQLLADEGLVTAAETDGRRVWTLTAAGLAAADAARDRADERQPDRGPQGRGAVVRAGALLAQTASLAAQSGTKQQVGEVVAVLDDARRRIIAILARG